MYAMKFSYYVMAFDGGKGSLRRCTVMIETTESEGDLIPMDHIY